MDARTDTPEVRRDRLSTRGLTLNDVRTDTPEPRRYRLLTCLKNGACLTVVQLKHTCLDNWVTITNVLTIHTTGNHYLCLSRQHGVLVHPGMSSVSRVKSFVSRTHSQSTGNETTLCCDVVTCDTVHQYLYTDQRRHHLGVERRTMLMQEDYAVAG